MPRSQTNITTTEILSHLFNLGIYAWRQNSTGIFDAKKGIYRPGSKSGVSDILGIVGPNGRMLAVEIKTGKDRLRPEQQGFLESIKKAGGLTFVVKDYDDFIMQFPNAD